MSDDTILVLVLFAPLVLYLILSAIIWIKTGQAPAPGPTDYMDDMEPK